MSRLKQIFQKYPQPLIDLIVLIVLTLGVFVFTSVSGLAEAFVLNMGHVMPFRGGLFVFVLVFSIGVGVYAVRRWRETQATEKKYRGLFENAPVGIFQIAPDGTFLLANQTMAELLGYASPAEMYAAVTDVTAQFYADTAVRTLLKELQTHDTLNNIEKQMVRRDGTRFWALINLRAVRNMRGEILYVEGNLLDSTSSRESESLYRNVVDQSLLAISILQQGRYVFANRAAAELMGYSVSELMNMTAEEALVLIHPDDRPLVEERMRDRLNGKTVPAANGFHLLRRDGTLRWLEVNAALIEYRGAPAIMLSSVDMTERKRAQEAMQANLLSASVRHDFNVGLTRAGTDLNAVLENIAHVLAGALGDLCVVSLVSADGEWVESKVYAHADRTRNAFVETLYAGVRWDFTHPFFERVIRAGETVFVSEFSDKVMQSLPGSLQAYSERYGVSGYLVVPIRQGARVLGVLGLLRDGTSLAYTSQDQLLVQEFADRSALAISNALLFQELQTELEARRLAEAALRTSLEQTDALQETALDIAAPRELSALLDSICERAARLLKTPSGGVYLCEPEEQRVRVVAGYNTSRDVRGVTLKYGEGIAGRVVVTGKPLRIPNYQTWEGRANVFLPHDFFSVLTVPIFWQAQVIGALTVNDKVERVFSDADLRLLTLFAEQAAIAVASAQLQLRVVISAGRDAITHIDRKSENVAVQMLVQQVFSEAFRDATALLSRVSDYDRVLDGILEILQRIVPYETASIFMRQGERLVIVSARGFEKYDLGQWYGTFSLPADVPKFIRISQTGKPLVVNDVRTFSDWIPASEMEWVRAHISAPILRGNQVEGMICLDNMHVGAYSEADGARVTAFAELAAAALRNAELFRQTERRANQLALLYDAGLTLNRVLDLHVQLEFLFQIARRMLLADRMAFFRYESDETLHYELGVGLPEELETGLRSHVFSVTNGEGLAGWVAQQRLPVRVADVREDERWVQFEQTVRAAVAVPVEHENKLHGVLLALSHQANAFNAQDERILILLGNQVAAAMELTRLFAAQTQRQHELEILRRANLQFSTTFHREELITQILDYALELVHADNAHLFLYEEGRLGFGGVKWTQPENREPLQPRKGGLTDTVAQTGKMIVVDRVNTHPLFANWQWGGAIVALPLRRGDLVRAVLSVAYTKPHQFETAELRALELLADQAAIALENARNYAETQLQLHDAQLLHRAGQALTRTLAFDEMLERLADFFMEAVGVEACCISTLDVTRDHLVVVLDRDPIRDLWVSPGTAFSISDFPYLRLFVNRQETLILHRDAPDLPVDIAANMDSFVWKSVLILPLLMGTDVIGCVELSDQKAHREFLPNTVRLAESLAHQAASALYNARLFERINRRAEELALLNRMARRVSGARTLDALGLVIEQELGSLLPSAGFFFALYEAAPKKVHFQRFVEYGANVGPFVVDLSPSLTQHVLVERRTLRLNHLPDDAPSGYPPQYVGDAIDTRSWLGAPMRLGDRVIGIIAIQDAFPNAYDEAAEQLLQTIADQVAVAVERVRDVPQADTI